jgi:hypothetical protein
VLIAKGCLLRSKIRPAHTLTITACGTIEAVEVILSGVQEGISGAVTEEFRRRLGGVRRTKSGVGRRPGAGVGIG